MTGKRKTNSLKGTSRNVYASRVWKGETHAVNLYSSTYWMPIIKIGIRGTAFLFINKFQRIEHANKDKD